MRPGDRAARLQMAGAVVLAGIAIFLLVSTVQGYRAVQAKVQAYRDAARLANRADRGRGAVESALAKWPDDPELLSLAGWTQLLSSAPDTAASRYRKLLDADDEAARGIGNLGLAAIQLAALAGEGSEAYRKAQSEVDSSLRKAGTSLRAASGALRGGLLLASGYPKKAEAALKEAAHADPPLGGAAAIASAANRSVAASRMGETAAAVGHASRAVVLSGLREDLVDRLAWTVSEHVGDATLDGEERDAARRDAKALLRGGRAGELPYGFRAEHVAIVQHALGSALLRRGDRADAAAMLLRALRSSMKGDVDDMASERTLRIRRDLAAAHLEILAHATGRSERRENGRRAAQQLYDLGKARKGGNPRAAFEAFRVAGLAFVVGDDLSSAEKALQHAETIDGSDPELHLAFATLYDKKGSWGRGHREDAIAHYKAAITDDLDKNLAKRIAARVDELIAKGKR